MPILGIGPGRRLLPAAIVGYDVSMFPPRLSIARRGVRQARCRVAIAAVCLFLAAGPLAIAADQPEFSPQETEFFEKQIRPLLVEHCHKCHGPSKQKGGLRLDTRAVLLKGGETGPAIVPGKPEESELVRAVRYEPDGYQMPPDGKLSAEAIAQLTKWVGMGAPWPAEAEAAPETVAGAVDSPEFLERAERWSFQPLQRPSIPQVQDAAWCRTPVDRFLLANLEAQGITPAPETGRRTWLRRVSLDVTGLPPTPQEVEAFVTDRSPRAYETVIDRLLASPHYGERWGRHWLDLVRYAESRGHEFDFDVANPWHYRDYVTRALNDDVPYDQFVVEHVAGDLLQSEPRPTSEPRPLGRGPVANAQGSDFFLRLHPGTGANESILATGFWFLGEWIHSPVDIRQDEADRFDNMLDVYSKTFLGLTVACARCHDHKFDPITQKDFYALQGYLQSSSYRQVRFKTMEHNRRVAEELAQLRRDAAQEIMPAIAKAVEPVIDDLDEYLIAARDLIQSGVETYPAQEDIVFADFESGTYDGWELEGDAFGTQPQTLETIADYQGAINAVGTYFVNSHQKRDGGRGDGHIGVMTSAPFVIDRSFINFWVGGGAHEWRTCILLLVDDDIPLSATGHNDNQMRRVTWDVRPYRGKTARIRIIDNEKGPWGNIGVDHVVFSDEHPEGVSQVTRVDFTERFRSKIDDKAGSLGFDSAILGHWIAHLLNAQYDESDPFYLWARFATGRLQGVEDVREEWNRLNEEQPPSVDIDRLGETTVEHWENDFGPQDFISNSPFFTYPSIFSADVRFSNDPEAPVKGVVAFPNYVELDEAWLGWADASGTEHEPGAMQSWQMGVSLRTPTFELKNEAVYCLIRGGVDTYLAVDSHVLIKGPLHGTLVREHPAPEDPGWRWIKLDTSRYKGHRAHIEFIPRAGEKFALSSVSQIDEGLSDLLPADRHFRLSPLLRLRLMLNMIESARSLARLYQQQFRNVRICCDWFFTPGVKNGRCTLTETDWVMRHPHLFGLDTDEALDPLTWESAILLGKLQQQRAKAQLVSAVAPAMLDGSGEDEYVFIRGSWKKRGEVVPRRFLEVFGGKTMPRPEHGSGRLALAEWMVDPAKTPVLPRVIVNRIWQHYFDRGIVSTPDDFGYMGRPPSHPELLDWLASELVESGWSLKHVHRLILNSSAYRMASEAASESRLSNNPQSEPRPLGRGPVGEEQVNSGPAGEGPVANAPGSKTRDTEALGSEGDVDNQLFSSMNVKRLEGEIIRDAMLAISGRLDQRMYGKSVPVHLTPFMEGRGRPKRSGPVDGTGRRSLYIAVRRNFADPFFQAFDMPNPHTTAGQRTSSNVPAQALALMNNPMVAGQSQVCAERLLIELPAASTEDRVNRLYAAAFSRPADENELAAARTFVETQAAEYGTTTADVRVWADLCHVLWNAKEFVFVR